MDWRPVDPKNPKKKSKIQIDQVHEPGPKAGGAKFTSKVAATFLQGRVQIWERAEDKGEFLKYLLFCKEYLNTCRISWYKYEEFIDNLS